MSRSYRLVIGSFLLLFAISVFGQNDKKMTSDTFTGLKFRSIGPALTSGRISDVAVDPDDRSRFFVAVASGGVWKTTNGGTTFEPIFDDQGSYSIGCVSIDPNNPLVIWLGTGENNSQRSVSYGDGIYKSVDSGKSWENVGLAKSEHIAKILIDPRNSDIIYVAAQGPLWNAGGDRGLYKSSDGGRTWKSIIKVDKHTGVTDIVFDPRNPDIIYAATYQRRRHVWTLINGGPGSALYKSTDAGKTWKKLTEGLPEVDMGRIGLAISPAKPDVVYAIIEAVKGSQGFYRSLDAGENWEKRNEYISGSPQYYNEIVADPVDGDRVYSLDTWTMVTLDGGKTWKRVGEMYKHVDNHSLWIDPEHPDFMLSGCDGGLYKTYDKGKTWSYFANLPITQFYRVTADNDTPFYNVYAGTQDNATLGGPSRNISSNHIRNSDWFNTVFGDGFKTQIDPTDPNIVYSQWQYGGLVRYDKRNGEVVGIQPQPAKGTTGLRWNWDSPLLISPHSHTRLYFASNILFRSEDRGNSWKAVSPDLSRQIDRNKLKVMDKVWSVDAVAKNNSTSYFGNVVSFDESVLKEDLLYAGTDDGLIQVSTDGGATWRKEDSFSGVPEMTYVSDIQASLHNEANVFAAFDNHKMGDFRPYILKSLDRGKSWKSISSDLPEKGTVYTIAQDHVNAGLLFAGTEFGLFFTVNGGKNWLQLKSGLPTINVREIDIQRRENDLVLGTFGRGIYILDDYTPLRHISENSLQKNEALTFPVKDSWMFIESTPLGVPGKAFQGDAFFITENPPVAAVFTYYLKHEYKTKRDIRLEKENTKKDNYYPSWENLRTESDELKPEIILTVRDEQGQVVRRIQGETTAGIHRVFWDMKYPAADPVDLKPFVKNSAWASLPVGPLAPPGTYSVSLEKRVDDNYVLLGESRSFNCVLLNNSTLPAKDRNEVFAFQQKTARLQRAVFGSTKLVAEMFNRIKFLKKGLFDTANEVNTDQKQLRNLELKLNRLNEALSGDQVVRGYSEPVPPSINGRIQEVIYGAWASTSEITETHRQNWNIAAGEFELLLAELQTLNGELIGIEKKAESLGTPYTPGRIPEWKRE